MRGVVGSARLTPLQAETASQQANRCVLCVVDLRGVSDDPLEEPWSAEDALGRARMVSGVGLQVMETGNLVDEARKQQVSVHNAPALRSAVALDA